MSIPIQNIYYLFCYAWGQFPAGAQIEVGAQDSPDLQNFLARVIVRATDRLIRRGVLRLYEPMREDTRNPRGRIDFTETTKRSLRRSGQLHCLRDDLQVDHLANQIIRTTIARLQRTERISREIRHDLVMVHKQLDGISEIRLTKQAFRRVQLHSNASEYRFVLRICELLFDSLLPTESGAGYAFLNWLEDETRMPAVFEQFVRSFYKYEQDAFSLGTRHIDWDLDWASEQARALLPSMQNDVRLDAPNRTIIIDTKYYRDALREHFGRNVIQSQHLYQLFAYLRNLAPQLSATCSLSGILMYPAVETPVDAALSVQGHAIRVVTLNLDQEWNQIRASLLRLLELPVA